MKTKLVAATVEGCPHSYFVLFIALLIVTTAAHALDTSKKITQYNRSNWQMHDGLSQRSVNALLQSRDGFVILGTGEGLVRFDGREFAVFDKINSIGVITFCVLFACALILVFIRLRTAKLRLQQRMLEQKVEDRTRELRTEVSERRRAQEALASERNRLSVTLRSIADGVITTDENENISLMNHAAEQLTGWRQEEAIGLNWHKVYHVVPDAGDTPGPPPDLPRPPVGAWLSGHSCRGRRRKNIVREILRTGEVIENSEPMSLEGRDGTITLITESGAPLKDQSGRILGTVIVFRDVTEKIKLQAEMLKVTKLESVGVLAGGIAHDFNNILTAIWGNISLAKMMTDEKSRLFANLEQTEKACVRARALTQQLLTFSKGGTPVKEAASIVDLLRETVLFALKGSNVRCDFAIPRKVRAVYIDPGQISQVINNVVINAVQAMPEGGNLRISVKEFVQKKRTPVPPLRLKPGRYVWITIRDNGPGMPAETLNRIFDPYFTTKSNGNGLGLAISYSIIKNHGGYIKAESALQQGTAFHIYLPATNKALPPRRSVQTELNFGGGKVLVMDDEQVILDVVGGFLEKLGHQATYAHDGHEAVELYRVARAQGEPFDAVILDLTVPGGMGGKETISLLREIDPGVRAVVSSGYSNDPVMARYRSYGFCGFIAKPYNPEALRDVLHRTLRAAPPPIQKPAAHQPVPTEAGGNLTDQ